MARVSIVMVLYSSEETLRECLSSLRASLESGDAELIAVDNASPDNSAEIVRREVPSARLISLAQNKGFAGGANAGLREVNSPYVLLLNPDVVVEAYGLDKLVSWMDANQAVGVASPELISADGARQSPGYAFPSAALATIELTRLHRLLPRTVRGKLLRGPYWRGGEQLDAGWVPGTAMIVRSAAIAQVGYLDERFFMYGEDLEWCWRFRRAGWKVGVCADVAFAHREGSSARVVWQESTRLERVSAGIVKAAATAHGRRRAQAFALATALNLALESIHPRRTPDQRARTRAWLSAWWAGMRSV